MGKAVPLNLEIADAIVDEIAVSARGIGSIINELNLNISPSLFYKWLKMDDSLRERYARARADQARVLAEEIAEIADNTQLGVIVTQKSDGSEEIKRADMIEHRKLRIESRKWLAAKLLPKVYGDKMQQELSGPDGGPLQAEINVNFVRPDAKSNG